MVGSHNDSGETYRQRSLVLIRGAFAFFYYHLEGQSGRPDCPFFIFKVIAPGAHAWLYQGYLKRLQMNEESRIEPFGRSQSAS